MYWPALCSSPLQIVHLLLGRLFFSQLHILKIRMRAVLFFGVLCVAPRCRLSICCWVVCFFFSQLHILKIRMRAVWFFGVLWEAPRCRLSICCWVVSFFTASHPENPNACCVVYWPAVSSTPLQIVHLLLGRLFFSQLHILKIRMPAVFFFWRALGSTPLQIVHLLLGRQFFHSFTS